jgi:hypothetical protein
MSTLETSHTGIASSVRSISKVIRSERFPVAGVDLIDGALHLFLRTCVPGQISRRCPTMRVYCGVVALAQGKTPGDQVTIVCLTDHLSELDSYKLNFFHPKTNLSPRQE